MLGLKRKIVWLARVGHCRGFGVQSPWAYMIVRYVINEHYPYYAYEPLAKAYPCADMSKRKLRELCLRLANYAQPNKVVAYACTDEAVEAYIKPVASRLNIKKYPAKSILVICVAPTSRLFRHPRAAVRPLKLQLKGQKTVWWLCFQTYIKIRKCANCGAKWYQDNRI